MERCTFEDTDPNGSVETAACSLGARIVAPGSRSAERCLMVPTQRRRRKLTIWERWPSCAGTASRSKGDLFCEKPRSAASPDPTWLLPIVGLESDKENPGYSNLLIGIARIPRHAHSSQHTLACVPDKHAPRSLDETPL
jgi:hypothetical protein